MKKKITFTCTPCGARVREVTTCRDCGCYFCDPCNDAHARLGRQCREYIEMFTEKDDSTKGAIGGR